MSVEERQEVLANISETAVNKPTEYKEFLYSSEARGNLERTSEEFNLRVKKGIACPEKLAPREQIEKFLQAVRINEPSVDEITDKIIDQRDWKVSPSMVVTMPVVGTGRQEELQIINTLEKMSKCPELEEGDIGVLILVNRPKGSEPDTTASLALSKVRELDLNAIVLEAEIPDNLGNINGPFFEDMATEENQVPIALLRDILSIAAMKIWLRDSRPNPPILLQMDGDFEGFSRGSFRAIIDQFSNQPISFLQCTSDWDSSINPTRGNRSLWIGSELMRELPQILKRPLNNPLPLPIKLQIVYGEAVQRGIQVPQAERMEAVARKGGYGLNRVRHDELDQNIRMSALVDLDGIRTTDNVVFLWSNRRAIKSWMDYRQPPISQWQSAFSVQDPVRQESSGGIVENSNKENVLIAINRTLERLPLPASLPGVYLDFTQPVCQVLRFYGIKREEENIVVGEKPGGLRYLQIINL